LLRLPKSSKRAWTNLSLGDVDDELLLLLSSPSSLLGPGLSPGSGGPPGPGSLVGGSKGLGSLGGIGRELGGPLGSE
jgi:hypothetical protein